MKATKWVICSAVVAAALVASSFALGRATRTEKQSNDAAVVRIYAEAIGYYFKHLADPKINLQFVGSRHIGRDVWVVNFHAGAAGARSRGHKDCAAIELDRITFGGIENWKNRSAPGIALVSCSAISAIK